MNEVSHRMTNLARISHETAFPGTPEQTRRLFFLDGAPIGEGPIDVEVLVQWTMAQTGYLPWRGVADRELEYDWGYTVIPAGTNKPYSSGGLLLRTTVHADANTIIDEVRHLEPRVAATVIACGRKRIRPHCFIGVIPQKVAQKMAPRKKKGKRRHRKRGTVMVWDIDPLTIDLARQQYSAWHAALKRIAERLVGKLEAFEIMGLAAPAQPWA